MGSQKGPFSRASAICKGLIKEGHDVACCIGEDPNYQKIEGVENYYTPVPSPMGLPKVIGKRMFKIAEILGVRQKRPVNSFEEVLYITGAIDKKHFAEDVACIRKAIQSYKPNVVYSEFNLSAIVAAKAENIKVATGYSFPTQKAYASNPEYCKGVQSYLKENMLPEIESVLDIFNWADLKIAPSSYQLEPINDDNVVFTGPLFNISNNSINNLPRKKIISYINASLGVSTVVNELTKAFLNSEYEVFIATEELKPYRRDNIIVGRRFDFSKLMPEAIAYLNHGGQNSIMTGLVHGVPQIICPGNVFERKYNADSVVALNAGIKLLQEEFISDRVKEIINEFEKNPNWSNSSKIAGEELMMLGGIHKAITALESLNK